MQPQTAVHYSLPGVNARPVGAVKVRLQTLARQQFGIRDQEVELQPAFVAVFNPQHAVLVFIEPGHQYPLKAGHQLFTLAGRQIFLREGQYARGIFLGVRRGVNQLPDFLRLPLQNACPLALPVFAKQVIHRPRTAAAAARMKLNDHRLAPFPAPGGAGAQYRRRSTSARPQSARAPPP